MTPNDSINYVTLGSLINTLTDYHANGAYEKLDKERDSKLGGLGGQF